MSRRKLFNDYVRFRVGKKPTASSEIPVTPKKDEVVEELNATEVTSINQLNKFRALSEDRQTQYAAYDEMKTDPIIAAALELYADDATQYDEQGRIIWVESDNDDIVKAGNRLLDILEIPERAWKHLYQACLYGDHFLKLYREGDIEEEDLYAQTHRGGSVRVVNDKKEDKGIPNYIEYVEDVDDPATVFDLRKRGRTAGYIVAGREVQGQLSSPYGTATRTFRVGDVEVFRPDRFVHIMIGENLSRTPDQIVLNFGENRETAYTSARGKSILQDVYPVQKEISLLEDTLLLNRLTRSSLIRLLEIEVGDMPKSEVNDYLRRIKNLIEQHITMDKDSGNYTSYNAPGPIDNVIYIPTRNGKGSVSINNLGGDVNVRDIADIDYFNNKRSGALKIPKAYLGDDMDGSGLSNGGSLTRLSIRYARTIKRIQTSYIRAITTLLNLFFVDKKLDYVNQFTVRMTSPSTQEDLERMELVNGNIDVISNVMDLTSSLSGTTQKKILNYLVSNMMKMPEIAQMIEEDTTPDEDIDIQGGGGDSSPDFAEPDIGGEESPEEPVDISDEIENGFSDSDFAEFEDEI